MLCYRTQLRVEGWDEDDAKSIQFQVFHYHISTENGYQNAVMFRGDFYSQSGGENVPIAGIKLPSDEDPNVHFIGGGVKRMNLVRLLLSQHQSSHLS